jgi:hypothetical protein
MAPKQQRIRVDQATNKGSVLDVVMLVSGCGQAHVAQTFGRLTSQFPEYGTTGKHLVKLRINGSGRLTPVGSATILIEIAYTLQGQKATVFRRASADMVRRMLGGDKSIMKDIERRHANLKGSAEESFLLPSSSVQHETSVSTTSIFWDMEKYTTLASEATQTTVGAVYMVTAPAVNLVKIGMWRGTMQALRSRFVTYYGQDLRIWAYATDDCQMAERDCHQILAPFCISNELFDPKQIELYIQTIARRCRECILCPIDSV